MAKISFYELNDMEKYNKNFIKSEYEGREESDVIPEFREYYAKNLPVDVTTWVRVNSPSENMIYKQGFSDQVCFVRDTIKEIFCDSYEEYKYTLFMVISTHTSKSIKLPVYRLDLEKYGITMVIRNNFHDWKISIISQMEINFDFMGLFDEEETINPIYCEGFEEEWVFESFKDNKKQFTVEIHDKYKMFTFMYLLNNYLKSMK